MKEQADTINEFLKVRFARERAELDAEVSDDDFFVMWKQEQQYYHSIRQKTTVRSYNPEGIKKYVEDVAEHYRNQMNQVAIMPLLRLARYGRPQLGDALARVCVDDEPEIFCADLGRNVDGPLRTNKNLRLYWANTDEGLKIIYWKFYLDDQWDHSSAHGPTMFTEDGTEIEVEELKTD